MPASKIIAEDWGINLKIQLLVEGCHAKCDYLGGGSKFIQARPPPPIIFNRIALAKKYNNVQTGNVINAGLVTKYTVRKTLLAQMEIY